MSSYFLGQVAGALIGLPFLSGETDFSFVPMVCIFALGVFQLGLSYVLIARGIATTPPGVGPICVAEHLRKFLPSHSIVPTGGDEGIPAVASAPWGSAMLFPITYGYIKMLGGEGLKAATEMAIVNANYMSSALKSE